MKKRADIDKFVDDYRGGKLSRRQFNQGLASVGLMSVMMPIMPRLANAASDDHPTLYTWGGYEVPEMHGEYIEKYGASPNMSLWGDEEEAEAKMRAGFHPDVSMPCSYKVKKWTDLKFIKPVDTDRLSHWNDVIPVLKTVPDTFIGDDRMMVTAWWGLTSVTFRTDLAPEYIPEDKHTWGILWDPKYEGRLSMIDSLIDGVMVAAIYSGAKDPFNMTPDEVEKVGTGTGGGGGDCSRFMERHGDQAVQGRPSGHVHEPQGRTDDVDLWPGAEFLDQAGDGRPRLRPDERVPVTVYRRALDR